MWSLTKKTHFASSTACHFPSKVITYKCSSAPNNPYRDPDLLRVDFEDRGGANVFQRYRAHFRKCLNFPKAANTPVTRRSSFPTELEKLEVRRERPSTCSQRLYRHAESKMDGPAKAVTDGGKHTADRSARSAPNTPRLTQSHLAKKNTKHKEAGGKPGVPRTRRGRRASSPAVPQQDVSVQDEPRAASAGQEVPVRTLWIFDAEHADSGQSDVRLEDPQSSKPEPEEPLPLSCQARRRSGFALSEAVTWRAAAPLPVVACRLAAATVTDRTAVMALGGADALGFSLDAAHIFENSKWTALPPLPSGRQALAAASLVGGVCALGGRSNSSCGSATVAADFFDLGAERWLDLPPLIVPRAFHAAAALDGKIYVLGGMDADGRRLASVDWLDPREGNLARDHLES